MKILKFGGKSLANGKGINHVVSIIAKRFFDGEPISVVVSARGNATDELIEILNLAQSGKSYAQLFESFAKYQAHDVEDLIFHHEFSTLAKLFEGVSLLGDYSEKP